MPGDQVVEHDDCQRERLTPGSCLAKKESGFVGLGYGHAVSVCVVTRWVLLASMENQVDKSYVVMYNGPASGPHALSILPSS